MLENRTTLAATRAGFAWDIPEFYNIGVDICDQHAARDPDALAVIDVSPDGEVIHHSFGALRDLSNQLAHVLVARCAPGDRVAVLLPQCVETAAAHIAILKMGGVSLPLFTLFGPDALRHRLKDAGARAVITNAQGAALLASLRDELSALETVLSIDGGAAEDFHALCEAQSVDFTPVNSRADGWKPPGPSSRMPRSALISSRCCGRWAVRMKPAAWR